MEDDSIVRIKSKSHIWPIKQNGNTYFTYLVDKQCTYINDIHIYLNNVSHSKLYKYIIIWSLAYFISIAIFLICFRFFYKRYKNIEF